MRLNNKLHLGLGQSFAQLMEFLSQQHYPKMRDRHIILIHVIAMLLRFELCRNEADPQEMIIETISYCAFCSIDFFSLEDILIEGMRNQQ